jgi:long-chain acyl-CoA synthetase
MTEAAPAISFSRFAPHQAMLGAVGMLLDGVEVRIDEGADYRPGEGEILCKSPGVMVGYYKQDEQTADVIRHIDGERWLATGDVGTLIQNAAGMTFLKITDRKKELLKTSGGKYIAPTPIESLLKEHHLVEQAMVVGENLKFVSALIVPASDGLKAWCESNHLSWDGLEAALREPKVKEQYQKLVDRINPNFSHIEQVKKFALLPQPWEPVKSDGSDAELTPTLKLKRRVIMKKFQSEIDDMYN